MAGPGYGGYFLKGLASGIQTGVNFGMQIYELKWQKEQRKKLKEKEDKIKEGMTHLGGLIKTFGADKVYSGDEIMQLDTVFLASVAEVQAAYKDSLDSIKTGNKRRLEEDFQWLDLFTSHLDDLDLKDVQGLYDMAEKELRTEKARNYFTAYKSLREKRLEAAQPKAEVFPTAEAVREAYPGQGYKYSADAKGYVPTFEKPVTPKAPAITDYSTATNYLKSISNVSPENFELARKDIEGKFGIDTSYITQDMYKEMNTATKKFYNTAEEAIANSPDIKGLTKQPVQISLNQWKVDYTKAEQTPEEEMREYYQKQFGTFKRNLLSGINDLGFIIDPENRDKYLSMNFDEYMQFMQGEIPARFGDDITVTDQATDKKQSIKSGTLFDRILNVVGLQKIPETEEVGGALGETVSPTEFQPEVTGVEMPKLGEPTPTPKVPKEGKEALIPTMTKEELHKAMLDTDKSDPLWDLLYQEAVKRGYITE